MSSTPLLPEVLVRANQFRHIRSCMTSHPFVQRTFYLPLGSDISPEIVAGRLLDNWIVNYGHPIIGTADGGSQLQSGFLRDLTHLLDCEDMGTVAWHSAANEIVANLRRQLKAFLMVQLT
ncbi:hypothetical protein P879_00971 [Paragonimus westermani]|uniref:Uncharacterized protein n=1 Tax=Paragonimus westermani TaxID=34504 RepID=A0A8T0DI55_9TREM|nr:hypothetical protein P879_00971 [Paragonimus westermani]